MDGSATNPATVRLGVAIAIPPPYGQQLDAARAAAGDPLAPVIPAHLTLLGPTDVAPVLLPAIEAHLTAVAEQYPAYRLHLRGTGTFRPVTEVVFVTVADGAPQCVRLAAAVRGGPLRRDLRYPYHPHVTVAHDVPGPALDEVRQRLAGFEARFPVERFTLYVHAASGRWRPVREFGLTAVPAVPAPRA